MAVNPNLPVSVSVGADQNDVCQGTLVTFTATPSNGGAPSFEWHVNGIAVGANQPAYSYFPANGDQVDVVATSSLSCVSGNPAASNAVSMAVSSIAGDAGIISGLSSVCAGAEDLEYSVAPIANSDSYEWSLPAGAYVVSGNNTARVKVNFSAEAGSGDITVRGSNSCGEGAVSTGFHVTVNPIPAAPVVAIQWPVLQSSSSEGNQWFYQGNLVPDSTGQTFHAEQPGWYWAVVTKLGCTSDSSNHVYVDGTDPGEIKPGILVYPVPNDGHFTISIILLAPETFNISIYNYLGERLYQLSDLLVASSFKRVIDLRPMPRGVYTVVFKCPGYTVVKKVLINKK
jgi:hypothetical protein